MENIKELKELASSYKVLYVEDDEDIGNSVTIYLKKLFQEVIYVQNGEEGLLKYKQSSFDLILTDIYMPIMDGLEMSKEIKKINKNQNIIIISAHSEVDVFLKSIKLGIDGFIIKPINYEDMNNLLFKLLTKIKIFRENESNSIKLESLVLQLSKKNNELLQYTDVLNQVAIVSKTNLKGYITFVNDFFCEISGYTREELLGKNHNIVRHPEMSKSVYKDLWDTIKNGEIWEGTIKNLTKSGEAYFVHATIMPLYNIEHTTISEYISIRFLTTKEEMDKRNFKRKVMISYQESKKSHFDTNKKVDLLENELKTLRNKVNIEEKLLLRNKKALTQIKFLEEEMSRKDENYLRILEKNSSNLKAKTESYKEQSIKLELKQREIEFIERDNHLRKKEIMKLQDQLTEQRYTISELRNAIKNSR